MEKYDIICKHFDDLTNQELYEILKARCEVFIIEQNCPYLDIDGKDIYSDHIFIKRDDGGIAACLRVFVKEDEPNTAQIGRVITTVRNAGLGRKILHAGVLHALNVFHADEIYLEAQTYATGYYAKEGFEITSEEFLEDGIPHVQMRRKNNT